MVEMIVKAQGKTFKFNLNNIRRGAWVVELHYVDDDPVRDTYSDPLPNERAARQDAKNFAERAYRHERWGWCAG